MKDLNKFTVAVLKDVLEKHKLPTTGSKAELIGRLIAADPEGTWLCDENGESHDRCDDRCDDRHDDAGIPRAGASGVRQALSVQQREIEIYRREKN